MRFVKGCTRRGRLYSEDVRKELKSFKIEGRIAADKVRWFARLNRTPDDVCRSKFCNSRLLDIDVQEDLEAMMKGISIFILGPEQAIRLFPVRRRGEIC